MIPPWELALARMEQLEPEADGLTEPELRQAAEFAPGKFEETAAEIELEPGRPTKIDHPRHLAHLRHSYCGPQFAVTQSGRSDDFPGRVDVEDFWVQCL